jgi:hypothetical protein
MVSLGRYALALAMTASYVAGCATLETSAQELRLEALCALSEVSGRLDVVPAGPGSLAVRLVTLDRQGSLSRLESMSASKVRGLAMIRVETPRPLLAVVLRISETNHAISSALAWTPVTITLAVSSSHPKLSKLESWAALNGVSLLVVPPDPDELPSVLPSNEGVDLRGAKDIDARVAHAVVLAERYGAAWIYGALNRPNLEAINALMRRQGEAVHVVGFEYITQPPTTPRWRRRCVSDSD